MSRRSPQDGEPIASVSRALGIPIPTIRSWERRYGFPSPQRTTGRHRRYTTREIEQLRDLRDLITRGYPARVAVARLVGRRDVSTASEALDAVLVAGMGLDSERIRADLDRVASRIGIEETIAEVIFPAMHEIGRRWRAGVCDIEREHLLTECVRTWLAHQAAMAPLPSRPDPIVLACGPHDLHTIGIESFALVLRRRGWSCHVLGALTPASALHGTVRSLRAIAAVVTAQRSSTRRAAVASLAAVERVGVARAFSAGAAFATARARHGVPGTYLGDDVMAAARTLEASLTSAERRRLPRS